MKNTLDLKELQDVIRSAMADTGMGYAYGQIYTWKEAKKLQDSFENELLFRINGLLVQKR